MSFQAPLVWLVQEDMSSASVLEAKSMTSKSPVWDILCCRAPNFGPQKGQKTDETMNFVVGEYFASEADETRWNEDWEEFSKLLKDKPATSTP